MARNFRPGNKWMPGVLVDQKGPLTFIVRLDSGIQWKRHVEHIRKYTPTVSSEQNKEHEIDTDLPMTSLETNTESTDEQSTDENLTSRYPTRLREPPDRYM